LLALAAGCGSDSNDESSDLGSKSPQTILNETAAALKNVKTFHVAATQGGSTSLEADVGLPKQLRLNLKQKEAAAMILLVDGPLYIKGNTDYWNQVNKEAAGKLADRWLKAPSSSAQTRELTKEIDPATLSRCLVKDHGTLTDGGKATVDGQDAIVLVDKGDRPGTAPGKLFVAAQGDPLPLRTIATGAERPGGTKDPECDDSSRTKKGDEALFSKYDESLDLKAPQSAVDLGNGASS